MNEIILFYITQHSKNGYLKTKLIKTTRTYVVAKLLFYEI